MPFTMSPLEVLTRYLLTNGIYLGREARQAWSCGAHRGV